MKEDVSRWLHFINIIFKREKINTHVDKINIEHSMHLDENELQQLQQQKKHKHIFFNFIFLFIMNFFLFIKNKSLFFILRNHIYFLI
jgi:hypothetical protein